MARLARIGATFSAVLVYIPNKGTGADYALTLPLTVCSVLVQVRRRWREGGGCYKAVCPDRYSSCRRNMRRGRRGIHEV